MRRDIADRTVRLSLPACKIHVESLLGLGALCLIATGSDLTARLDAQCFEPVQTRSRLTTFGVHE